MFKVFVDWEARSTPSTCLSTEFVQDMVLRNSPIFIENTIKFLPLTFVPFTLIGEKYAKST